MKNCIKCGVSKELTEFPRKFTAKDGRQNYCKHCVNEYARTRYWKLYGGGRPALQAEHRRITDQELVRQIIIDAYGPVCVCCGETTREFLTIDHINGGGLAHVRRAGNKHRMMLEIVSEGFPKDKYRILCSNCNFIRRYGAECPHQNLDVGSILEGMAC